MAHFHKWQPGLIVLSACLACIGTARAEGEAPEVPPDASHWRLLISPFTHHFRYSAEHRPVWALGVERQRDDGWLAGATYFRNSFGQPSGYVYMGHRYDRLMGVDPLFAQWSAGLLYGYKGKYQTKVPLNVNGYSPGVLLSAGWKFNEQQSVALHLLGDAAVMLQLSYDFR